MIQATYSVGERVHKNKENYLKSILTFVTFDRRHVRWLLRKQLRKLLKKLLRRRLKRVRKRLLNYGQSQN